MAKARYPHSPPEAFAPFVQAALDKAGLLARANGDMIVLERIAYGAGATNWYHVHGPEALAALVRRLWPGSSVSFYFDNRIAETAYGPEARAALETWWKLDEDAVLLMPGTGDFELDFWSIAGHGDLADLVQDGDLREGDIVRIGRYPGWDNDGVNAIELVLPDKDGIVRSHPY